MTKQLHTDNHSAVKHTEKTLKNVPQLFAQLGKHLLDKNFQRPKFDDRHRKW